MKENWLCIVFRMTTKRKHNEVTLKAKYEALEEFDKKIPIKEATIQFNIPRFGTNQSQPFSVEQIVSEFSEQPTEVITDGHDENENEEPNEQMAHL